MQGIFLEVLMDSIKMVPLLLVVYIGIELIEYKFGNKIREKIQKVGKAGPMIGATVGSVPQCGFSVTATALYTQRLITIGTLLAVYLATSDEAIPIILAQPDKAKILLPLILTKIFIALLAGYLIDFLFIVIGLSSLFVINKKGWMLFLAVIVGCSVTSGLSLVESSYSQRVGLMYPFLIMLSAVGVGTVITMVKSKRLRLVLTSLVALLYLISLVNLLHIYFVRFQIYASDGWFFQDRVLSSYIKKSEEAYPNTKIVVYTVEPKIIFEEYLFYTNKYDRSNIAPINKQLDTKDYSINNVLFTDRCPDKNPVSDTVTIFEGSLGCYTLSNLTDLVRISRLKDVHANYYIYSDKLCKNLELGSYIPLSAYQDFSVEKQSPNKFCLNWITKIKE